jgi:7-keto-8-aminopelargonate synthetase-like enzyme
VILDDRAHRSILDACRLARVPVQRFAHNDVSALETELEHTNTARRTLIIVEGVYSMDGDICPLPQIVEAKSRFGAHLMVDEAHSFAVLGQRGRGVDEHFGVNPRDVDLWMGSLSKAIPSNGGFLAGGRELINYLKHESAPFFFSAAACPASVAAARAALRVVAEEPWRRERVMHLAQLLREGLQSHGISTGCSTTPIIPVVCGSNENAWKAARGLADAGILASAVVPPAVPRGSSRLRLCCMATHTEADMLESIEQLAKILPSIPIPIEPAQKSSSGSM